MMKTVRCSNLTANGMIIPVQRASGTSAKPEQVRLAQVDYSPQTKELEPHYVKTMSKICDEQVRVFLTGIEIT